jgi:hypothetical protein
MAKIFEITVMRPRLVADAVAAGIGVAGAVDQ